MDDRLSCDEQVIPLGEWAQSLPVILDGKPFTFDKHEYLRACKKCKAELSPSIGQG